MRNLTIKREKHFAACLAAMKVYIEDPAGDITIVDTTCRKLGELKNGEEKTFAIDETELKVFVIAGEMSRNYCNDFYRIPAGQEDVFLSGRNVISPTAGNPFRFNGAEDAAVLQNRKQGKRKGLLITIPCMILGAIIGFTLAYFTLWYHPKSESTKSDPKPKEFTTDGMTITLNDRFQGGYMDDGTLCYDSEDVAVFVIKEEGLEEHGVSKPEDFGQLLMLVQFYETPSAKLQESDGLTYIEYTFFDTDEDATYHYFAYLYKGAGAFWEVTFATNESDLAKYRPQIAQWAKSVEFAD